MADVILDTNIVIDYLSARRERHAEAVDLLEHLLISDDEVPVVPAGCLKDIYYILCRHYQREDVVRMRLDDFRSVVEVADLDRDVLDAAFASDEPDLEDGIVRATAELRGAAAIVTRDADAYAASSIPHVDASTYLRAKGPQPQS